MAKTQWFSEGKYGLFIHFGLYSLLAGEWEGKRTKGLTEWILLNEKIPADQYEALSMTFDPVHFDARAICRKAKAWGIHYLCFTSKHHDGFALFDSAADSYNSVRHSKCGRDFVRELAEACREEGLVFCLYYSQAQDWHHPGGYRAYEDNSQIDFRRYMDEKCLPQVRELLTQYGPIGMMWFDTPMGMTREESQELVDLVKSLQPDCLINGRIGNNLGDYLTTQDNRIPSYPINKLWEVPGTLNSSWGYKHWDHNWHKPEVVIEKLLNIVARGGNYLLNIGPRGDGSVPEESEKVLDYVGAWLREAGPSIYGTSAVQNYVYEAPEIRFTHKDGRVYVHVLGPERFRGQEIPLPNIKNQVIEAAWLQNLNLTKEEKSPLRVTQTLEGDPYWGLRIPQDTGAYPVLTLEVKTLEKEFLQKFLDE